MAAERGTTGRSAVRSLRSAPLWLVVTAAAVAAIAAIPLVYLAVRASEAGLSTLVETLGRARVAQLTINSLGLALAVTASSLLLGTAVAWVLTRLRVPFPRAWLLFSALPLAVPSYLASYGWLVVSPSMNGFFASWLLMTAVCTPYVTLPVAAALRAAPTDMEGVARTLGYGPTRAFFVATWPEVRPAAAAGALLVCLYTLSDFGLVSMLRFQTLTWGINAAYGASFDRNQAALLALLLVAIALVVVAGERRSRKNIPTVSARRARPRQISKLVLLGFLPLVAVSPIVGVAIPLGGLAARLLQAETIREIDLARLFAAIGSTLGVAALAAIVAVILALPIAALAARYRGTLATMIESLGMVGHALPGIVVGLSLVFFALAVVPSLYQSVAVLVFGYVVLFLPKSIGTMRAGISTISPRLATVARTLGLTPWQAWWRVTARLALPSVGVGAMLVAIATMKELPATLLLRPTGVTTLATELWSRTVIFEFGAAAPYAAALVLLAAVPAVALSGVRGLARETL
ncbi:MAG: ABC transporter permease [Rhodoglobus sp.]